MIISGLEIIGLYLPVFAIAEALHHFGVPSLITRKFVHVGAAIVAWFLPMLVTTPMVVVVVGLVFAVSLGLAISRKLLGSVHQADANSWGSVMFPLGVAACAILFWNINPLIFQGSVLLLGLSDGLGGLFGYYFGKNPYRITGSKTWEGSIVFFLITFIVLSLVTWFGGVGALHPVLLTRLLFGAVVITLVEGIFSKGWDNLFVPIVSGLALYFLL